MGFWEEEQRYVFNTMKKQENKSLHLYNNLLEDKR